MIGDIGSHWLDLMSFVTGHRVEAVMADLTTFMPVRKQPVGPVESFSTERAGRRRSTARSRPRTPPACSCASRAARAASSTLSQVSAGRKNHLHWEIDGSLASAAWRAEAPEELWLGHRDRPNELLLREPGARRTRACPGGHAEGFAETFRELYRAVYTAVAAGAPPAEPDYPTFAAGHEQALIGDAIARSHAEGRWVGVHR